MKRENRFEIICEKKVFGSNYKAKLNELLDRKKASNPSHQDTFTPSSFSSKLRELNLTPQEGNNSFLKETHSTGFNKFKNILPVSKKQSRNPTSKEQDKNSDIQQVTRLLSKKGTDDLLGVKRNIYKTNYSKLNRKKQEKLRSKLFQKEDLLLTQKQTFHVCSEEMIQKYRWFSQNNDASPVNLFSKMYQQELMSAKQMKLQQKINIQQKMKFRKKEVSLKHAKQILRKDNQSSNHIMTSQNINRKPNTIPHHESELNLKKKRQSYLDSMKQTQQIVQSKQDLQKKNVEIIIKPEKKNAIKIFKTIPSQFTQKNINKVEDTKSIKTLKKYFASPKNITASSYIVFQSKHNFNQKYIQFSKNDNDEVDKKARSQMVHCSFNMKSSVQIASLTKIMTAVVVIEIVQKFRIDPFKEKYRIGKFESSINGTSAEIEQGQIYNIDQLLHGLMLPSGNDASLALARWGGNVLLFNEIMQKKSPNEDYERFRKSVQDKEDCNVWASENKFLRNKSFRLKIRRCINRFLAEMNKKARKLCMQRTSYANTHGLMNLLNKSCAYDLVILCDYAMQNEYFRKVVRCKSYTSTIQRQVQIEVDIVADSPQKKQKQHVEECFQSENFQEQIISDEENSGEEQQFEIQQKRIFKTEMVEKTIEWNNTHKLTNKKQEYLGIKTGVTMAAGACLASCLHINQKFYIIIVLNCTALNQRFKDTQILKNWLCKKEKHVLGKKDQPLSPSLNKE